MRIAVIGSGITGMGAAWLLRQQHEVIVYEQSATIGGHANTLEVPGARPGETIAVDTGFIVFNAVTYPNLTRLFDHLGVPTRQSGMSFGVSIGDGRLEYAGPGPRALFAQRRNLFRPAHYRMLCDLLRFYHTAPSLLDTPERTEPTLGAYLAAEGYGDGFVHHHLHLLPMGAAIWSSSCAEMLGFRRTASFGSSTTMDCCCCATGRNGAASRAAAGNTSGGLPRRWLRASVPAARWPRCGAGRRAC